LPQVVRLVELLDEAKRRIQATLVERRWAGVWFWLNGCLNSIGGNVGGFACVAACR
jgi:hypothetical protein